MAGGDKRKHAGGAAVRACMCIALESGIGFSAPLPPPRPADLPRGMGEDSSVAPLPPPRPENASRTEPPLPRHAPNRNPARPDPDCFARLSAGLAIVEKARQPDEVCQIDEPVELKKVLTPQGEVAISPPALLRCPFAETFALWVRHDLGPLMAKRSESLQTIVAAGSFECRGRNGYPAAKPSEHGRGDALDLDTLATSAGHRRILDPANVSLAKDLRLSACARFSTVLGPGSDALHNDHVHVDNIARPGGYRICQWDMME